MFSSSFSSLNFNKGLRQGDDEEVLAITRLGEALGECERLKKFHFFGGLHSKPEVDSFHYTFFSFSLSRLLVWLLTKKKVLKKLQTNV